MTVIAEALETRRWLAWLAVIYVIGHHTGTILGPLGGPGPTRWADWVDLLLPYAVLGAAAMVLLRAQAPPRAWLVLGVGGLVYTQGHGIHLAANSVGNELGHAPVITVWDEHVGHYLWYLGVAIIVAALVLALRELRLTPVGWFLAALVTLTLTTNAIEGQSVPLNAALAVGFVVAGRLRAVRLVYGAHLLLLLAWVAYWAIAEGRWSPEFTELGWI
ncbi:MAG TPA: hypothetical protein VM097_06025 [Mycobacteriales bacterium]|nr:hypothetical protein [Mycobacteriales bacterium]